MLLAPSCRGRLHGARRRFARFATFPGMHADSKLLILNYRILLKLQGIIAANFDGSYNPCCIAQPFSSDIAGSRCSAKILEIRHTPAIYFAGWCRYAPIHPYCDIINHGDELQIDLP